MHAPLPLPKYEASQASLNAPIVEAICGVEANICSIMPPQLSLQHSAPAACQSRRDIGARLRWTHQMGIQRPAQPASQLLGKVPSVQPFLGQQMVFISLKVVVARSVQDWPVAGG